jgi:hypothetical protein
MDDLEKREMSEWVSLNVPVELWVTFDPVYRCVMVGDSFGSFRPFSWAQWVRYVETPYALWKKKNPNIEKQKVISIALTEFKYMYICNN